MPQERLLMAVITYPVLLKNGAPMICCAGLREDGSWLRVFPVAWFSMPPERRFGKFDLVRMGLSASYGDSRPETRHLLDRDQVILERVSAIEEFESRLRLVHIEDDMASLVHDCKAGRRSISVFRPASIHRLTLERSPHADWDHDKMEHWAIRSRMLDLFDANGPLRKAGPMPPHLPYRFYVEFSDRRGTPHRVRLFDLSAGLKFFELEQQHGENLPAIGTGMKRWFFPNPPGSAVFLVLGTARWNTRVTRQPFFAIGVIHDDSRWLQETARLYGSPAQTTAPPSRQGTTRCGRDARG